MSEHDDELENGEPLEPDGEPDGEPAADDDAEAAAEDGEPEAAAPAPPTQKEIDARHNKLDAEAQRHEKRVAEIMGDDFALLIRSPLDWTPGFLWNPAVAPLPPEIAGATMALLGVESPADYAHDPGRQTCDKCNGLGQLATGSLVQEQATLPCRFCRGYGWTGEGNPEQLPAPTPIVPQVYATSGAPTTATLPPPNQPVQAADRWGRPAGHPHYNIDPAQVGVA